MVTSNIQRPKNNRFSFYLIFLLFILKAPKLCRKTYFQIKVNKSGSCHNLGPGRIPWDNFRGNRSCQGSIFILFLYFVYIAHFSKFARGSSLFMETSLLVEKSKSEEIPREKKKKTCLQWVTFPLIHRHWRQEVPLSYWFAVLGGKIISECGASCLRTFMS